MLPRKYCAPPRSDLNVHDDRTVEATISEELLGGEDVHLKQLHTSSDDSVVIEGMELQSVSCSANHETIFSPSHAQNDVLDAPDSCVNADVLLGIWQARAGKGNGAFFRLYQS